MSNDFKNGLKKENFKSEMTYDIPKRKIIGYTESSNTRYIISEKERDIIRIHTGEEKNSLCFLSDQRMEAIGNFVLRAFGPTECEQER